MQQRKESNRRIYTQLYGAKQKIAEFDEFAPNNKKLLKKIEPWSNLYLLPYELILVTFYHISGLTEHLIEASRADDPEEAWLTFSENELQELPEPGNFEECVGIFLALLQCMRYTHDCVARFHATPNQLINTAIENEDFEPIYKAVFIDKTIASGYVMSYIMAEASITQNADFFNQLARSINGSRPYREKPELDDLRFMMEVNLIGQASQSITSNELHEILVVDLELHPAGDEALDSLRKLIQKRNKIHRKYNTD